MQEGPDPVRRFFCDAMLGGLARWIRAMGHDAAYEYGIDDADLVRRAAAADRTILTSDGPLLQRNEIASGQVPALFVPRQLGRFEQLGFVVEALDLPRLDSRCMACGGVLHAQPKHAVAAEVPPLAFRNCQHFWRCDRCGKLYWHGTHWQRIDRKLEEIL